MIDSFESLAAVALASAILVTACGSGSAPVSNPLPANGVGSHWSLQTLPLDLPALAGVSFTHMCAWGSDLYLVGSGGTVLHSNDDGTSWVSVGVAPSGPDNAFPRLYGVATTAAGEVWIGGDVQASAATDRAGQGTLRHSTDAGSTWQEVAVGDSNPVNSLWAIDRDRLLLSTSSGEIWRTTDAGASFARVFLDASVVINDIWGSAPDDLYAVGFGRRGGSNETDSYAGVVLHSTDVGETWSVVTSDAPCQLWAVTGASDGSVVYAVGNCGSQVSSTDHGATWSTLGDAARASTADHVQITGVWVSPQGETYFAVGAQVCRSVLVEGGLVTMSGCEALPPRISGTSSESSTIQGLMGEGNGDVWAFAGAGLLWRRH